MCRDLYDKQCGQGMDGVLCGVYFSHKNKSLKEWFFSVLFGFNVFSGILFCKKKKKHFLKTKFELKGWKIINFHIFTNKKMEIKHFL